MPLPDARGHHHVATCHNGGEHLPLDRNTVLLTPGAAKDALSLFVVLEVGHTAQGIIMFLPSTPITTATIFTDSVNPEKFWRLGGGGRDRGYTGYYEAVTRYCFDDWRIPTPYKFKVQAIYCDVYYDNPVVYIYPSFGQVDDMFS